MPLSRTINTTQVANDDALSPEQLALLERARADGWVTQDQILAATPDAETNLDNLDELMAALQEAGILVLESPPTGSIRESVAGKPPGPTLDEEALVLAADMDDGVGV